MHPTTNILPRVNGLALDVQVVFGQNRRRAVFHFAAPVEVPPQHLFADRHLQHVPRKRAAGVAVVDPRRALEHL